MARETIVVNLFAGPGAGKTTCAWEIASKLKKLGYVTEYVAEYAKELVWDDRTDLLDGTHQNLLRDEQAHRVERLIGKVDFVVTDSPLLLNVPYLKEPNAAYEQEVLEQFNAHHNFNIFIERAQHYFETEGRIHDEEQSRQLDQTIKDMLQRDGIPYGSYRYETVDLAIADMQKIYAKFNADRAPLQNPASSTELPRVFLDMDGTLARFHDEANYLERMFEPRFFAELSPFENAVAGVRECLRSNPGAEVYILSATVDGEPPYCLTEKNKWLDEHLPEIDAAHRIFTPVGADKSAFIPGGIQPGDTLLDDYNKNLEEWRAAGGHAVKFVNNINDRGLVGELWQGERIRYEDSPHSIAVSISAYISPFQSAQEPVVLEDRANDRQPVETAAVRETHTIQLGQKKPTYTPEERAAWRQEQEDLCKSRILEIAKNWEANPQDIAEFAAFQSRFYRYSARNAMLIYQQNPDAFMVASFQKFKEMGYSVKKGEHGMKILVPRLADCYRENGLWLPVSRAPKELQKRIRAGELPVEKKVVGFGFGTVFDIAQTDCPREEYPKLMGLGYQSEQHAQLYDVVEGYCESQGFPVKDMPDSAVGTRGYYDLQTHEIFINPLLGDTQKLSTLLHEMSHGLLIPTVKQAMAISAAQKEFEADTLSIMLNTACGVEIPDARKEHLVENYKAYIVERTEAGLSTSPDEMFQPVTDMYRRHIEPLQAHIQAALSPSQAPSLEPEAEPVSLS